MIELHPRTGYTITCDYCLRPMRVRASVSGDVYDKIRSLRWTLNRKSMKGTPGETLLCCTACQSRRKKSVVIYGELEQTAKAFLLACHIAARNRFQGIGSKELDLRRLR